MAKGAVSAELGTQMEFSRPQGLPEQKHKALDNVGVSGAIGALNQDNPKVKDRTDLVNLAKAGQRRKYSRFDTMSQYREAKKSADGGLPRHRIEPSAQKSAELDESKRIYEEPHLDPLIRTAQDRIVTNTNLDPRVMSALKSGSADEYRMLWYQENEAQNRHEWDDFARNYPEKAAAYAEKHQGIKAALEEIKRQEQTQQQAQTSGRVQAENNQLLADSVRRETNDVSENMASEELSVSESETKGTEGSERIETGSETKLLSIETAGVQATLLLGGEISAEIDRAKIEAIAAGGPINSEKANKASLGERQEYWNGENSPFKGMTFEQQLERWQGKMQEFFDQYKGKPEAEFFKRIGVDLENENAVREIHQTYFVDGKGDLGLLTQKIAQNNSAEQIQENRDLIQKLGKMYGEKSAKAMVEMTIGIKNAQTDMDSFIKAAEGQLKKDSDTSGVDLANIVSGTREEIGAQVESGQQDNISEGEDSKEERESEKEKTFREVYSEAGEHTYYKKDKWRGSSGQIILNGDNLSFTPAKETHGGFNRDTTWMGIRTREYDRDEGFYRHYEIRVDEAQNFERGVELAVDVTNTESWDPAIAESTGMRKVPTPFMWELLETNPESVGKGGHTFDVDAYGAKILKGKKYVPGVDSFYGIGGRASELVGETTVGFVWNRVNVDRETVVRMQNQAIEYIERQVQEGQMPQEMLDTAKGLIDSHKAPDKIIRALKNDRGRGKNQENPKLYLTFLQQPETWKQKGQVRTDGDLIVYDDDKYRKKGERREIEIATTSIDTSGVIKKVLTKQSWDILKIVPEAADIGPYNIGITEATTNALLDRKGEWKKFIKPFTTDGVTLGRMQQMVRTYVEAQVQQGNMDAATLVQVDNLLKLKQATLKPAISTRDGVVYDLRGEKVKAQEIREIRREPRNLVEKISEGAGKDAPISSVVVTDADIRNYLMTKELPFASITQLDTRFQGQTVTLSGEIKAGFGFIKGKLNFSLGIANKPDGSGLMVTGQSFNTDSNMIRSHLGDVESQLNNINGFIGDDINDQLQRINPNLRLLGLTISPEGTFLARVQNAQQAAAA